MSGMAALWLVGGLWCATVPVLAAAEEAPCPTCENPAKITWGSAYSSEYWRALAGGLGTGGRYLDNLDLHATLDGKQTFGLAGLTLYGDLLYNNGHAFADELVGASQGVSNIETTRALRLFELWGDWRFGTGSSVRAGLYDLNSEFDSIAAAGLFIQPSQGIGADLAQSGVNGPSIFPVTALALRFQQQLGRWSLQTAVLDGVPGDPNHPRRTRVHLSRSEGALLIAEAGYDLDGLRVSTGYWQYTGSFGDLETQAPRDDNAGAYLSLASPRLFAEASGRGLDLYARVGEAQADINPIGHYLGAGMVYHGLARADASDQLGLSVAIAALGAPFRRLQSASAIATTQREYAWELTYRLEVNDWLAVQPDLQYIRHPGMNPALESSWVVGLRLDASRTWPH